MMRGRKTKVVGVEPFHTSNEPIAAVKCKFYGSMSQRVAEGKHTQSVHWANEFNFLSARRNELFNEAKPQATAVLCNKESAPWAW